MEVAHIDVFRRDPERFWHFYGERFTTLRDKQPNGAHHALAELERRGHLARVITQNIDGLHAAAGTRDLIEVHGSISHASCLECGGATSSTRRASGSRGDPAGVPRCDCGAPLKPDVVLFGELLPERRDDARAATLAERRRPDAVRRLVARGLPGGRAAAACLRAGGALAIVTKGATPYDGDAAVELAGDVVEELEAVVAAL